jgi:hypothetical protein
MIRYLNLLFFGVMIYMNYLANALPLNNQTTGELSDAYPNLFVPAGITFSIWGIIYLLIAIFCVLQFFPSGSSVSLNMGWLFTLSCILNAMWIVAWHYQKLPFSLLIMAALLIVLIYINVLIRDTPYGLIKATFGVYLGWICIATIANVTALLVFYGWNGFGIPEQVWTIVMIAIGTLIVILALMRFNNPFIGLAVIWAFTGIIIKRSADYRLIVIAALLGIVAVGVFTVRRFLLKV